MENVVLFVDDKPHTHQVYREGLTENIKNLKIRLALDLEEAVNIIADEEDNLAVVVLDLYFPRAFIPKDLRPLHAKYKDKIRLNEGQLLGCFLTNKGKSFFYFTAYLEKYQDDWEDDGSKVVEKGCTIEEFLQHVNSSIKAANGRESD